MVSKADFKITGFASHNHPRAEAGEVLVVTEHTGLASAMSEVKAWQAGMARGHVSHCEIIDQSASAAA